MTRVILRREIGWSERWIVFGQTGVKRLAIFAHYRRSPLGVDMWDVTLANAETGKSLGYLADAFSERDAVEKHEQEVQWWDRRRFVLCAMDKSEYCLPLTEDERAALAEYELEYDGVERPNREVAGAPG